MYSDGLNFRSEIYGFGDQQPDLQVCQTGWISPRIFLSFMVSCLLFLDAML